MPPNPAVLTSPTGGATERLRIPNLPHATGAHRRTESLRDPVTARRGQAGLWAPTGQVGMTWGLEGQSTEQVRGGIEGLGR